MGGGGLHNRRVGKLYHYTHTHTQKGGGGVLAILKGGGGGGGGGTYGFEVDLRGGGGAQKVSDPRFSNFAAASRNQWPVS